MPIPETRQGRCGCGAVKLKAIGPADKVTACHCTICQRINGGPFAVSAVFANENVEITGPLHWFKSSATLERGFCPSCGSSLTVRFQDSSTIDIWISAFDDQSGLEPEYHIWWSSRQPWLVLNDDAPKYDEWKE